MAISDKKKVQTMINIMAEQALEIRASVDKMKAVRVAFQAHSPDVTGTPLDGQVVALNTALNDLETEINSVVWDGVIAAIVPTHKNNALD